MRLGSLVAEAGGEVLRWLPLAEHLVHRLMALVCTTSFKPFPSGPWASAGSIQLLATVGGAFRGMKRSHWMQQL